VLTGDRQQATGNWQRPDLHADIAGCQLPAASCLSPYFSLRSAWNRRLG
jgi:hypothetical protein